MKPDKFVKKWAQIHLKEMTTAQSHFNDVCRLIGHPTPLEADPAGEFFTFEAPTEKASGKKGRADAWYKGKFIWEYKGAHKNLDKAYQQLLLYREYLGNPPLLITSDTHQIIIHTNFVNAVQDIFVIDFDSISKGNGIELLVRAFNDPLSFEPSETQEHVTKATADTFVEVAKNLQDWAVAEGRHEEPERLAHFIIRLLFCLFAEDMGLLPDNVFTKLVEYEKGTRESFAEGLTSLFLAMELGGTFGFHPIPNFNGGLFDDDYVPDLPGDIVHSLRSACTQDWSKIDPSIFGTLFERVIDEAKRAELGLHYTSKEDIMLIVEPVVMQPLRDEWTEVRRKASEHIADKNLFDAQEILEQFALSLSAVRILDPACGSGNFLYVTLRQLLDLQKAVIAFAGGHELDQIPLTVSPAQLFGIEINPYAHELAQVTVWIGYIQWKFENGFGEVTEPILQPLKNIELKDAILEVDDSGNPIRPKWPESDFIIGNPPFLGGNKIRKELGDRIVDAIFDLYSDSVPAFSDLVCYWFERAKESVETGNSKRAGLIATDSIRGGVNNKVLERIKQSGDIFMAWTERPWILDGASVRVSIVGFDNGSETRKYLNNLPVASMNSDLSAEEDLGTANKLGENKDICFYGSQQKGSFSISEGKAKKLVSMHRQGEPDYREVVKPSTNGLQLLRGKEWGWVIDFGVDTPIEVARTYKAPFAYIEETVYPERKDRREKRQRTHWWLHARPSPRFREILSSQRRYLASPATSKHRIFVWLDSSVLADHSLVVYAREDDYFFGVMHSKAHEIWAFKKGTFLEDRPRYTPSSTFETFPFPWPPGSEPTETEGEIVTKIAVSARKIVSFRQSWLWPDGVGVTIPESIAKKRTLTNLYNSLSIFLQDFRGRHRDTSQWNAQTRGVISLEEIEELANLHGELDSAVFEAYGWPYPLSDEEILRRLLKLNHKRSG